jgi:hypothetical protein
LGSASIGFGGSLSNNMAKGGSGVGNLGGGSSSLVNVPSGTGKGSSGKTVGSGKGVIGMDTGSNSGVCKGAVIGMDSVAGTGIVAGTDSTIYDISNKRNKSLSGQSWWITYRDITRVILRDKPIFIPIKIWKQGIKSYINLFKLLSRLMF